MQIVCFCCIYYINDAAGFWLHQFIKNSFTTKYLVVKNYILFKTFYNMYSPVGQDFSINNSVEDPFHFELELDPQIRFVK